MEFESFIILTHGPNSKKPLILARITHVWNKQNLQLYTSYAERSKDKRTYAVTNNIHVASHFKKF